MTGNVATPHARALRAPTATRRAGWPADRIVFTACLGVVALHTTLDVFVLPEPGTSPSDRGLGGIVTLALLAVAVAAYPRVRVGARAAAALVLGPLALLGAGLALAEARGAGLRGDDWSGLLLGPAGVALLALGAALLWRSRKRHGRRHVRRALLALAGAVAAVWVVLPIAVAIMATHRPREAVGALDLGRPYEQVRVRTSDGLDLDGRYVASRNGAAVIVFPGSASRAPQARLLVRHGYGVLMLDMRGYGRSDGAPNMFGWGAAKDIAAGVRFLRARDDVRDGAIGGLGFSVGGEMMLEAAAGNRGLRAVVSEGAGARSVREEALNGPRGWLWLPAAALQTTAVAILSGTSPPPALTDLVPRIAPRPVLLVYAGHGVASEELNPRFLAAAREPKALWRIPEAGHTGGYSARPLEYERRVVGFFDRALLPSS